MIYPKDENAKYENGDLIVDENKNISINFAGMEIPFRNNLFRFGTVEDLNIPLPNGIYNIAGATLNKPAGISTGILLVINRMVNEKDLEFTELKNYYNQLQIIANAGTGKIIFRNIYNNEGKIEIKSHELNLANQLNIYHLEKMKQEGVYDDYISYMDEKTVYDKQQRKLEQDRQLAYEEALKENPELTYEEFMSVQSMTLNLVEEPQPSDALKKFMDKYL